MAFIYVTEPGTTVAVSNGDTIVVDIPGGGDVTIVASAGNVRNFRIRYGDDDGVADTVRVDLDTFSRPDLQILVFGYDPTDQLFLDGADGLQVNPSKTNEVLFGYGDGLQGRARILDPQERDLTDDPPPLIICFAEGTVIDVELGPRPVESLCVGDLVRTVDNGAQPVRWIGRRTIGVTELAAAAHLAPVRIRAGALGEGLPWMDLTVSPQHRIRLSDWRAELLYGASEVLVPAKALIGSPGIGIAPVERVTYLHLLFDRHELLWSNGLVSESLHPGEMANSVLAGGTFGILPAMAGDRRLARTALRVTEARAVLGYAA